VSPFDAINMGLDALDRRIVAIFALYLRLIRERAHTWRAPWWRP
jgi:hypothetical protein